MEECRCNNPVNKYVRAKRLEDIHNELSDILGGIVEDEAQWEKIMNEVIPGLMKKIENI